MLASALTGTTASKPFTIGNVCNTRPPADATTFVALFARPSTPVTMIFTNRYVAGCGFAAILHGCTEPLMPSNARTHRMVTGARRRMIRRQTLNLAGEPAWTNAYIGGALSSRNVQLHAGFVSSLDDESAVSCAALCDAGTFSSRPSIKPEDK